MRSNVTVLVPKPTAWADLDEIAAFVGVSRNQLLVQLRQGRIDLPARNNGRNWRIYQADFEAFKQRATKTEAPVAAADLIGALASLLDGYEAVVTIQIRLDKRAKGGE